MISVIQVTEADGQVGFGHLRELGAIGASFENCHIPVSTYVIGAAPRAGSWGKPRWSPTTESVSSLAWDSEATIAVWSFRRKLDDPLQKLFDRVGQVRVWITDQPAEPVPAHVVVIPTITAQPIAGWPGRILQGLEYLPIETSFADAPPPIEQRDHEVLMTLGGADPSQATLRLLPALAEFNSTVVIGPAFAHAEDVQRAADRLNIRHIQAPDGLQDLLQSHKVVISAGGNTLAEAAASATPALVTWEDPHERRQGEVFESRGAAIVVGQGTAVEPDTLREQARTLLDSTDRLKAMSAAGRKTVDGRGAARIVEAILEELNP